MNPQEEFFLMKTPRKMPEKIAKSNPQKVLMVKLPHKGNPLQTLREATSVISSKESSSNCFFLHFSIPRNPQPFLTCIPISNPADSSSNLFRKTLWQIHPNVCRKLRPPPIPSEKSSCNVLGYLPGIPSKESSGIRIEEFSDISF